MYLSTRFSSQTSCNLRAAWRTGWCVIRDSWAVPGNVFAHLDKGFLCIYVAGNGLRAVPSAQRLQPNGPVRPDEWNAVWTEVMPFNELRNK